jgi:predicted transcriptional regulator
VKTRLEKAAEARRLRDEGLKQREIADCMGVARSTVNSWLVDPDGSMLKARKHSYRGECEECGSTTTGSRGPSKAPKLCANCWQSLRWDQERDERIKALWENGVPSEAIGHEIGLTASQVRSIVSNNLRRRGQVTLRGLPKRDADQRYGRIATLIRQGLSNDEIAGVLGTTAASVNGMASRARSLGYEMPYRSEVAA